jgi:hypothetical protein
MKISWNDAAPPKGRQILAFALAQGSKDAAGIVAPIRVIAEFDSVTQFWRPVRVAGDGTSGVELKIICWADIPDAPFAG